MRAEPVWDSEPSRGYARGLHGMPDDLQYAEVSEIGEGSTDLPDSKGVTYGVEPTSIPAPSTPPEISPQVGP